MGVVAFALAWILGFGAAVEAPSGLPPSGEVFAHDFPDPMVIRAANVYYAYATETAWETGGVFPVLRSVDLHHWSYVADALPGKPAWAYGDLWAPSVVQRGGTFYMYYSAAPDPGYADHCVAVATARRPAGPFVDHGPIACADGGVHGFIDPMALLDAKGGYLYFSVDYPTHSISMFPLTPDLLHEGGPRVELFGISQPWEQGADYGTVEGPFVVRQDATYFLFYSGNDWKHDYGMGYATAASPAGPFTKSDRNPVLSAPGGPGGGSLFLAGGRWILAYHQWGATGRTLHMAPICLDPAPARTGCPSKEDSPARPLAGLPRRRGLPES